jgi:ABC-type Fe3+-hydroxamate transport system substrate-binding protein
MQFIDQLNRTIELKKVPDRIVSLVPSQTELLIHLGLSHKLVGITKFCIHPYEVVKSINKVGGTKNFHIDKIRSLNPDLIIANKEENEKSKLKDLIKDFPVWISDVKNLNQAIRMINEIGLITNKENKAKEISQKINNQFNQLNLIKKTDKKVLYIIWQNPFMSINRDTFINDMIKKCGWQNVCSEYNSRYPKLSIEEIKQLNVDIILLSSEPYPFKEKHKIELQKEFPKSKIKIVDGELFSWYGNKLLESTDYFIKLIKANK